MILGFKEKFSDGTPTYFREKILSPIEKRKSDEMIKATGDFEVGLLYPTSTWISYISSLFQRQ
jgi:hypothetical protein